MLGRIVYCNNVSVEPWSRVRPRKGLGETDRVRSDDVAVVVLVILFLSCYLVLIVVTWCRSYVSLSSFRSFTVYAVYGIIMASIQFSAILLSSQFLNPCICQSSWTTKTHPPTRFYCPPQSKNVVFIPKLALFTDFRPFLARSSVK